MLVPVTRARRNSNQRASNTGQLPSRIRSLVSPNQKCRCVKRMLCVRGTASAVQNRSAENAAFRPEGRSRFH
jgi:hypothetical protein